MPDRASTRRGVVIGLTLSAINFVATMARIGPPVWSSAHVTWNSILGTSIFIRVFEEIPFRGFVLQKLQERFDRYSQSLWAPIIAHSLNDGLSNVLFHI